MDKFVGSGHMLSGITDKPILYSRQKSNAQNPRTEAFKNNSSVVHRGQYKAPNSPGKRNQQDLIIKQSLSSLKVLSGSDLSFDNPLIASSLYEGCKKKDGCNHKLDIPEKDLLSDTHNEITNVIAAMSEQGENYVDEASWTISSTSINLEPKCSSMASEPHQYKYTLSELKEIEPLVSCLSFSSLTIGELENLDPSTPSKNHKYAQMWTNFKKEFVNLQQSLKLSRADTTILVTAKQKLQLSLQEALSEKQQMNIKLKEVTNQLAKLQSEIQLNREKNLFDEKRSESLNKSLKSDIQEQNNRIKQLNDEVERLTLDNSRHKHNEANLKRNLNTLEKEKSDLTREVSSYSEVNLNLKSLLNECQETIAGDKEYITTLRTDRDNYAAQLYQCNQGISSYQMTVKQLQKRGLDSHNRNVGLKSCVEALQHSAQVKDAEIERLSAQLASRDTEKSNLDQLVTRLNKDVNRVENEFTKIKRNVALKSEAADEEENMLLKLKSDNIELLKKLEQTQAESLKRDAAINDKKNEIEELRKYFKTIISRISSDQRDTETTSSLVDAESNIAKICDDSPNTKDNPNINQISYQAGGDQGESLSQCVSWMEKKVASLQLIIKDKDSIVKSLEDKISQIIEQSTKFEQSEPKLLEKVRLLEEELASLRECKLGTGEARAEKLDRELLEIRAECNRLLAEKSSVDAKLRQLDALLLESEQKSQLAKEETDHKASVITAENSKLHLEVESLTKELGELKSSYAAENERTTQLLQSRTQEMAVMLENGAKIELSRGQLQTETNELHERIVALSLSVKSSENRAAQSDAELERLREVMTQQNECITILQEAYREWAKKTVQHLNQSYPSTHSDACTADLPRVADALQRISDQFPDASCECAEFLSNFRKLYSTLLNSISLVNNSERQRDQQPADGSCPQTTHQDPHKPVSDPSPSHIHSTNERTAERCLNVKLKAYKQTVKVLRKQLQDLKQECAEKSNLPCSSDSLSSCISREVQTDDVYNAAEEDSVLQSKIDELLWSHRKEMEECQKKRMLERAKNTKNLQETRKKIERLLAANEDLRKTVDGLQVSKAQCNKRLEMTQREKCRYRSRSRSLQASLRSMTTLTSPSKLDRILENNHLDIDSTDSACEERTKHLDDSVNEITKLLGNMRDNMFNLERQVTEEDVDASNHMVNGVDEEGH